MTTKRHRIIGADETFLFLPMILITLMSSPGCTDQQDPQLAIHRSRLIVDQDLEEKTSIEDAQSNAAEKPVVTITGWADLTALEPKSNSRAIMLVREILADEDGHGSLHDANHASSCKYCQTRLEAAPKAAVEFVGADGKALPYSVVELFELAQGDQVVIRGKAELDESLDMLKIKADKMYVRRQSD